MSPAPPNDCLTLRRWVAGVTGKTLGHLEGGEGVGEQVPSAYDEWDGDLKLDATSPTWSIRAASLGTIGSTLQVTSLLGPMHRLTYGVDYYHADYDQLIDRVAVAPGVQQRQNIGEAYIQGISGLWAPGRSLVVSYRVELDGAAAGRSSSRVVRAGPGGGTPSGAGPW